MPFGVSRARASEANAAHLRSVRDDTACSSKSSMHKDYSPFTEDVMINRSTNLMTTTSVKYWTSV
uniref:Uncharacterized protein n=1 Tax=Heterorhabditis bacteriophora TaxID=37862 RepID=A0A1I7XUG2_HETBA